MVPKTAASGNLDGDRQFSSREKYLEERLAEIEAQFKRFQETLSLNPQSPPKTRKGKGKGKGKKSQKSPEDIQVEINKEAERRLRDFLSAQSNLECLPSTSTQHSKVIESRASDFAWTNDSRSDCPIPNDPEPDLTATKPIFIKRVEVTINGTSLDQVFLTYSYHLISLFKMQTN